MKKAVSIFILDVSDSSKFENGRELSTYLYDCQNMLESLNNVIKIKSKYRMGDEIICLVEGYSSAIMIANYLIYNWYYEENMPYFGLSCGLIDEDINDIDIETWNHLLVKKARIANDLIKEEKNRKGLIEFNPLNKFNDNEIELINTLLDLQSAIIVDQTNKQREILGLYSLIRSQKEIANKINKSTSTVSGHYTGGKSDLILEAAKSVCSFLTIKEIQSGRSTEGEDEYLDIVHVVQKKHEELEKEIRKQILNYRFS
ncbi:hypothetical protein [Exiguobacterium sp. s160]|uniref:hypothetical protein n=1 Tax=Exiguobacterium sp. s160 TaxID=2751265 RepID=UPI001BE88278|nr:hypothetical protein [Exiguobacterium sp. s160]